MVAVAFDTYRVVKRLREAGFDERQAEAVTTAIQDSVTVDLSNLVTKDHFDERMNGIDERFKGIDERFRGIDERFKEIDSRFKGLDERISGLAVKISESKAETLKSVMAMISGAVVVNVLTILGSMFALIKILGH